MKKRNKKLNKSSFKISKHNNLYFLSMQVFFCLDDKTLAEEIESMMAISYSGTAYHIDSICKVCEVAYHEDDKIVEFDIAFAAPKYEDCIKACSDLMGCGCFPINAECTFIPNKRSEKLISLLWHEKHDKEKK